MKRYIKSEFDMNSVDAFNTSPDVRRKFASITEDPELLAVYAFDPDYWVRSNVLENPYITSEILDSMAEDYDTVIRSRVAEHRQTSPDTLLKLADDLSSNVRGEVASNPNTPKSALLALLEDSAEWIRIAAKNRLGL